jgi:hypothetical protein
MNDLFGPAPAPASPSQPPARARQAMTNATCGLRGHLSSASAALEQSLVSRLRQRLDGAGSILFSLTWKRKATPAGRPYYQLAASARRTSETGFGSSPKAWTTPTAGNACGANKAREGGTSLNSDGLLAAWPTPDAGAERLQRGGQQRQQPQDGGAGGGLGDAGSEGGGWDARAVPSTQGEGEGERPELGVSLTSLSLQATLAGWATAGLQERERDGRVQRQALGAPEGQAAERGSNAGFWSDIEWLPCSDGKARPVEPGSFPLAHGVQRRASKLRAYGNAIVPQVAAEFVQAFLEAAP